MWPWGQPGPLEQYSGPDTWQRELLTELGKLVQERGFDGRKPVMPVRMAVSSGHGIGKSVLAALVHWWIMSTRPHAQGTVSANTFTQLETKTWAAIRKWGRMCLTGHWFNIGSDMVRHCEFPESWFSSAQSCREENAESFAGQHAAESTSFYIFDEASGIPDRIFEVADGGMTDGEPMQFRFGNPWHSQGEFYACAFGAKRKYWNVRCIDSRNCRFSNKEYIAELIEFNGEDSDRVRVQVRGLPPRASTAQFIDSDRVWAAQNRAVHVIADEPLIGALDCARGGNDNSVIRWRKGRDGRVHPPTSIPGEKCRDSMWLVGVVAREIVEKKPEAFFVDETGGSIGGPIGDRLRQLGHRNVIGVQFAGESPDPHCANMRAYIWSQLRDWLDGGAIDKNVKLETDLTGPGFGQDRQGRLLIESKEQMKKRDLASPDEADALALTFARPVMLKRQYVQPDRYARSTAWS